MTDLRLDAFLPYRLNRLSSAMSLAGSRVYRDAFGLTIPEWRVLATLGELTTATASTIGRHSAMHKTKVSRAVAALESRRWLARTTDIADRRIEHLRLTDAGRKALARLVPDMTAFERRIVERLSDKERAALATALDGLERVLLR